MVFEGVFLACLLLICYGSVWLKLRFYMALRCFKVFKGVCWRCIKVFKCASFGFRAFLKCWRMFEGDLNCRTMFLVFYSVLIWFSLCLRCLKVFKGVWRCFKLFTSVSGVCVCLLCFHLCVKVFNVLNGV